eukprot:Nitzschia sp. Nitz4//scaffold67_size101165//91307//92500//NITZ4_004544-RA/size101165-processed-gene-0.66-mRNA-1//-1//CDS//3329556519//1312//frame0
MASSRGFPNRDGREDKLEFRGGLIIGGSADSLSYKQVAKQSSMSRYGTRSFLLVVVGMALLIAFHGGVIISLPGTIGESKELPFGNRPRTSGEGDLTSFQCPTEMNLSTFNFVPDDAVEDYLTGQPVLDENFLSTYRTHDFDGWAKSFEEVKESLADFKIQHFVPYLRNGDTMYESACGLGLNLYLTLELLQEHGNITNITVYGNEYLGQNAYQANLMLKTLVEAQEAANPRNQVGAICRGDSTDLRFVPSNAFDLVFTGYVSPLWDPLHLGMDTSDVHKKLQQLCRDAKNTESEQQWEAQKLVDIMQERMEAWYNTWFQELIRIAKPGAPVIVEEVALPICEMPSDWGGVTREYWRDGMERYGWDLNRSTLDYGSRSEKHDNGRYHVFFRKNWHDD